MISFVAALTVLENSANENPRNSHMEKNKYGQYFTPQAMADFMIRLSSKTRSEWILEPSAEEGFVDPFLKYIE